MRDYSDLIGKKFGQWEVLKKLPAVRRKDNHGTKIFYECLCTACNRIFKVDAGNFKYGNSNCCKSCTYRKKLEGKKIGAITVVKYIGPRGRHAYYLCKCDCGKGYEMRTDTLRKGKHCGCYILPNKNRTGNLAFNQAYHGYRSGAKNRGLSFLLTKDDFRNITQQKCHYCGMGHSNTCYGSAKPKCKHEPYHYNGIDRVDNSKGYEINNCVPCCKLCNLWKHALSKDDFLSHVRRISQWNALT